MFGFYLTQYSGTFLGPIAKVLGWILSYIYKFLSIFGIENAAVSIILFTFFVNLLMLPLTIKQQKYSKMTTKMQPELNKIQEKYQGKKDEASMLAQQEEMKAVYEKYGTSPTGGCLPMIITMFVFLALYRVIYAIPAYVPMIKDMYTQLAEYAAGNKEALQYLADNAASLKVVTSGWGDNLVAAMQGNQDYIIDVFTKFGRTNWQAFQDLFQDQTIQNAIATQSEQIMHVNGVFGGLNIAETPLAKPFPGLIIPIISVILNYVQNHMVMAKSQTQTNAEDPMAASMKSMNAVMPLMSGFFSLMFPIGAGIYLISSSVFRIIQQFFVNRHMDHMDLDAEIEKNMEKAREKREKLHLEVSDGSIKNVAAMRTSNSKDKSDDKHQEQKGEKKAVYEKGSIAAIAHMMEQSGENE